VDGIWAAKSTVVGLIDRAVNLQDFQSNGPDPPTLQTDGQTTCDRKTALCTKCIAQ